MQPTRMHEPSRQPSGGDRLFVFREQVKHIVAPVHAVARRQPDAFGRTRHAEAEHVALLRDF